MRLQRSSAKNFGTYPSIHGKEQKDLSVPWRYNSTRNINQKPKDNMHEVTLAR
jgi:hypothetical protein